jgi:hypothetical protein
MFLGKHCTFWSCDNQKDSMVVFKKCFKSHNYTYFQLCFLRSFFSPSKTTSRDCQKKKKMKETTVTKLECMKTIPPPPRQGRDPTTLCLSLVQPLELHVHSALTWLSQPNPALASWQKGRWFYLLRP